jgi:hypothetical protein
MSITPRQVAPCPGLFDQATGQWIGVVNIIGEEQPVLTPRQIANLTGNGLLSGVTYDASNRAISWTIDGVGYTASYSSTTITVAGGDGTITSISLDPANRITGVITA